MVRLGVVARTLALKSLDVRKPLPLSNALQNATLVLQRIKWKLRAMAMQIAVLAGRDYVAPRGCAAYMLGAEMFRCALQPGGLARA